jgi:hypothetical protein
MSPFKFGITIRRENTDVALKDDELPWSRLRPLYLRRIGRAAARIVSAR